MPAIRRFVTLRVAPEKIREEMFNNKKHLVAPVVALREGVLRSATSEVPELALASEFGSRPGAWNGRPVTLGHPKVDGEFVSASESPEIMDKVQVGSLFNFRIEDKALKGEAFIDINLGADLVNRLKSGEPVEVSTAYFVDSIEVKNGSHEGESFNGIQRGIKPDHLAFLDKGDVGACSWADGCGAPRVNGSFLFVDKEVDSELKGVAQFFKKHFGTDDWLQKLQDVISNKKDTTEMDKKKVVDALIANKATKYTEDNRGWLMAMEDKQLELLVPAEESAEDKTKREADEAILKAHNEAEAEKVKAQEAKDKAEADKKANESGEPKVPTVAEFIASAPAEIGEMLSEGLASHNTEHEATVKVLVANESCLFDEAELKAMKLTQLRKLARLARIPSYEGGAGPGLKDNEDDPNRVPDAPDVWDLDEMRENAAKRSAA